MTTVNQVGLLLLIIEITCSSAMITVPAELWLKLMHNRWYSRLFYVVMLSKLLQLMVTLVIDALDAISRDIVYWT